MPSFDTSNHTSAHTSSRPSTLSRAAQIILLVLPLLALLLLGLYFIIRDRRSVEQEARERAAELARATLDQLRHAATNLDLSLYLAPTNPWPSGTSATTGTAFFQVTPDLELVFPPPIFEPEPFDPLARLNPEQTLLWTEAERAEFELHDLPLADQIWTNLLASNLPDLIAPIATFKRAVLLERLGRPADAYPLLDRLFQLPLDVRLESGLSIPHLAAMKLLDLAIPKSGNPGNPGNSRNPTEPDPILASFVTRCLHAQLAQPSSITPYFLRHGSNSIFRAEFARASEIWTAHQLARRLHAHCANSSETPASIPAQFKLGREQWWTFPAGTNILLRSTANLRSLTESIANNLKLPLYLSLSLADPNSPTAPTAAARKILAQAADPPFTIHAWLARPDALYALQRQRAWLFGGVLASSLLVAAVGLVQIHRNHRRQERLNQLKSNFVSSVSHELRAPLASMRLMSEGLQSGRIDNPEKQREYFDFLVQECRRLSVLVENVLDFSRIEQNRKTYVFADASLHSLCEAALKSINPVAHEHEVKLSFEFPPQKEAPLHAEVDSFALQQAIVNLLDNAIKHSPPGETVTLCLASHPGSIDISVQDRGPGIPPAEHQRIFEQFYRLGSELRRETQGIGIGLSIVQHTVQAHRGQILLESQPGQGATFTLRIPRHAKE